MARASRVLEPISALALDTRLQTAAFWGAVALTATSLVAVRFPPLIDYPQHLALVGIMDRIASGAGSEQQRFDVQWVTYNGFFHFWAFVLSRVVSVETAGKVLVFAIPWLTAGAGLAVVRLAQRPTAYAFVVLPLLFSRALGWGFINFSIGAPLAVLALVAWMRWWLRRRGRWQAVVVLSSVLAWVHPFAFSALALAVAGAFLVFEAPGPVATPRSLVDWLRRAGLGAAPFLPALATLGVLYARHMASPALWFHPAGDGYDVPLWQKLSDFPKYACANFSDGSDTTFVWAGLSVVVLSWTLRYFRGAAAEPSMLTEERPLTRALAFVVALWLVLYAVCPQVVFSTGFVFERFALLAWNAAALLPPPPRASPSNLEAVCIWLGVTASLNVPMQLSRMKDGAAAHAIIEKIPAKSRVVGLMFDRNGDPSIAREIWIHLPAYALVRREVELAFDFTHYASLPVTERVTSAAAPQVPGGFEWRPDSYQPDSLYGVYYDWVLVGSKDEDPKSWVFGETARFAQLVAREGRFSLYRISHEGGLGYAGAVGDESAAR